MKQCYLEVTYWKGKALAAYLYLPRRDRARVTRSVGETKGMRVDFDAAGTPMGIELTNPTVVTAEDVNAVLARLGQPVLPGEELAPLKAA